MKIVYNIWIKEKKNIWKPTWIQRVNSYKLATCCPKIPFLYCGICHWPIDIMKFMCGVQIGFEATVSWALFRHVLRWSGHTAAVTAELSVCVATGAACENKCCGHSKWDRKWSLSGYEYLNQTISIWQSISWLYWLSASLLLCPY